MGLEATGGIAPGLGLGARVHEPLYKEIQPVDYDSWYVSRSDVMDTTNAGKDVEHIIYSYEQPKAEATYKFNGKYDRIAGVFAVNNATNHLDTEDAGRVYIYADDELVVETPRVGTLDDEFEFKADISGCKRLKIVFENSESGDYNILYNMKVRKAA